MLNSGVLRHPVCCWNMHLSCEFPLHYSSRLKGPFALPKRPIQEVSFWFGSRHTAIGHDWLAWASHGQLWTASLRFGCGSALRKGNNSIVNHCLLLFRKRERTAAGMPISRVRNPVPSCFPAVVYKRLTKSTCHTSFQGLTTSLNETFNCIYLAALLNMFILKRV